MINFSSFYMWLVANKYLFFWFLKEENSREIYVYVFVQHGHSVWFPLHAL